VRLTSIVLRSSVDNAANDHEHATKDDAGLATEAIGDGGDSEHGENGSDGEHVGQEAKQVGLALVRANIVKIALPVIVLLQKVEE
jgi:hypothetical protein